MCEAKDSEAKVTGERKGGCNGESGPQPSTLLGQRQAQVTLGIWGRRRDVGYALRERTRDNAMAGCGQPSDGITMTSQTWAEDMMLKCIAGCC